MTMLAQGTGLLREPVIDHRRIKVEEVAKAFGAPPAPDFFFSPYTVAAFLRSSTNIQYARNTCVMESDDKGMESISAWEQVPDEVDDGNVIEYLFDEAGGKIHLKPRIAENMRNYSPVFGYWNAKQHDRYDGPGTYLVMAGRIGVDVGLCQEHLHPSTAKVDADVLSNRPSQEAFEDAAKWKLTRYAETRDTFESYKLGIWTGIANGFVGGYDLGGGADLSVMPQKPPTSKPSNGHANWFFGYELNYRWSIGSYGTGFGATLYLKIVTVPGYGKKFARGTQDDHVVAIRGCHQLGRDWFPKWTYGGIALYDQKFTPELEARINMLQTLREKETGKIFAIFKGEALWVTPGGKPDTIYEKGRGEFWPDVAPDQVPEMLSVDLRSKYPEPGVWGKPGILEYLKFKLGGR